jgi:small subunit ribosomal protein S25e
MYMGGVKKKTLSQADKTQAATAKKPEKEARAPQKAKRDIAMPKMDENQAIKLLGPMKAITVYNTAKALNIKASVASALLRTLESKGILRKYGGFSGHYVYALTPSG